PATPGPRASGQGLRGGGCNGIAAPGDVGTRMGGQLLDERTADGILSGVLAPEDVPPGYVETALLLQAAHQPPTPQELARCAQTVAAMAGAVAVATPAPSVKAGQRAGLSRLLRPRIAATLMAGALALFGGLASAGALPGSMH